MAKGWERGYKIEVLGHADNKRTFEVYRRAVTATTMMTTCRRERKEHAEPGMCTTAYYILSKNSAGLLIIHKPCRNN